MADESVTVRLPGPLLDRLLQRAEQAHRTVEDEVLDLLVAAVPVADELQAEIGDAISPLAVLDDEALWNAARTRFAAETSEELERLHFKRQREGLTEAEEETNRTLLQQHERVMLVRAHAAALLKQRGYDVSSLLSAG